MQAKFKKNKIDIQKLKKEQQQLSERIENYKEISKFEHEKLLTITDLLEKEVKKQY